MSKKTKTKYIKVDLSDIASESDLTPNNLQINNNRYNPRNSDNRNYSKKNHTSSEWQSCASPRKEQNKIYKPTNSRTHDHLRREQNSSYMSNINWKTNTHSGRGQDNRYNNSDRKGKGFSFPGRGQDNRYNNYDRKGKGFTDNRVNNDPPHNNKDFSTLMITKKNEKKEIENKAVKTATEKAAKIKADKESKRAKKEADNKANTEATAKIEANTKAYLEKAHDLVGKGIIGEELMIACMPLAANEVTTAHAIATAALATNIENLTNLNWVKDEQFGLVLKNLCKGKGSIQKQAGILYACQAAYYKEGFPKTSDVKNKSGKKESYLEKLFFDLYDKEIVEEEAFTEWRYADNQDNGKIDALFQITDFLVWLDEPVEEEDNEDDDEPPIYPHQEEI